MKTYHLTATKNKWILTLQGRAKPLEIFRAKDPALEKAIDLTSEMGPSLQIHRKDGTITEGRTYPQGLAGIRCYRLTPTSSPRPSRKQKKQPVRFPMPAKA